MAEKKNTNFNRPGGYATPTGATAVQRKAALEMKPDDIRLFGDSSPPFAEVRGQQSEVSDQSKHSPPESHPLAPSPSHSSTLTPAFSAADPDTRLYIGDCREVLANLPDKGNVDLVFADPPFNWEVPYAGSEIDSAAGSASGAGGDGWKDGMSRREYERFTFDWIDGCIDCLAPHGSIFINIPDDTAAECVMHLKRRGLTMINWCIWHFRFGQHRDSSFIMSKVHVLYFAKSAVIASSPRNALKSRKGNQESASAHSASSVVNQSGAGRIWNPDGILELSDRASIYADPRTMAKDSNKGLRVPMDVWYGKYWGRIQGNNKERRHNHHNQIPEIYLERVIKACSNPVADWRGCTTEHAETAERKLNESVSASSAPPGASVLNHASGGFGSLVLDPFCGSGTTSTVARALGRRSITIEYSKVNAKSAWDRIMNVGMIKREDADKPQSTAIFKSRRKGDFAGT